MVTHVAGECQVLLILVKSRLVELTNDVLYV